MSGSDPNPAPPAEPPAERPTDETAAQPSTARSAPPPAPPPPPPAPAAPAGPPAAAATTPPSPVAVLIGSLSQAERLILGGALVILIVDLVFGIVVRGYSFSDVVWAAAAAALLVAWLHRRSPTLLPVAYETALMVLAALAAVVAGRKILSDLLFVLRPPIGADAAFVLGMLGLAVGAAAMGLGAWWLARGRR